MTENPTDLKTEFEKPLVRLRTDIQTLTGGMELITCASRQEYDTLIFQDNAAAEIIKQVKTYWDGTDETPGPVKAAYNLHKDLSAKKMAFIKPLEAFRAVIGRVSGAYLCQEQQKAQEQALALAKQARKMGIDTSLVPLDAPKVEAGDGRAMVQKWVFDVKDEKLIPREYFILDTSAVQKVVSALKDKCRIPGIVVRMEASVRRTGR